MEIKVLFENSRINLNFKSGHGLSLLINYSGKKYLFDAGANKKLVYNATKMGETLNDLEAGFCCKVLNLLSNKVE
ncbi:MULTISPECIES: MBL fold metallo-hydrolase [Enterococcus]|uniref:hypothetical protein n=1 Tax=Enterococcus TaxID=1350 RepID=UPI000A969FD0|nr:MULTISPECIES: hypothetical protein [Enterococcus]GER97836.1 hypothetical protein EfmAA708_28710 [Enterococcus faecium]